MFYKLFILFLFQMCSKATDYVADLTKARVVCFGDSNTAGVVKPGYVENLQTTLDTAKFIAPVNKGFSGYKYRTAMDVIGQIDALYNSSTTRNYCIVNFGTNDINEAEPLDSIYKYAKQVFRHLKTTGFKCIAVVPGQLKHNPASPDSVSIFADWRPFTNWMKAHWRDSLYADAFISLEDDQYIGMYKTGTTSYWNADKIHYTLTGYAREAEIIKPTLDLLYSTTRRLKINVTQQ